MRVELYLWACSKAGSASVRRAETFALSSFYRLPLEQEDLRIAQTNPAAVVR